MPFAAVELGHLLDVIGVSLVASVVVTTIFAVVVRESARAAEARRSRTGRTAVHAGIAVLGLVAFAGIVVVAVVVMLNK